MRRYLPHIIVIAVGLITVGSAAVLYRYEKPVPLILREGSQLDPSDPHIRGSAKAKITLEEFGDYQCPPCGMLSEPLNELEKMYSPEIRVVFRNFPLPTHTHSREAAFVAEAAALQGKFWEMHDLLFKEQANWAKESEVRETFKGFAKQLGLDVEKFEKDVDSDKVKERVQEDQKQGTSIGVVNTPTVFLNNRSLEGKNLSPIGIRESVEAELKQPGAAGHPSQTSPTPHK